MCLYMYVGRGVGLCMQEGKKRVLDPSKLELEGFVGCSDC